MRLQQDREPSCECYVDYFANDSQTCAEIIADSAEAFLNGEFNNLLQIWGVARRDTVTYDPRTNAEFERCNRTIK